MRLTVRRRLALFLPFLVSGLRAGCGGGGGGGSGSAGPVSDTTPPHVESVSVPDDATNGGVDTVIRVTFSEAVQEDAPVTQGHGVCGGPDATAAPDHPPAGACGPDCRPPAGRSTQARRESFHRPRPLAPGRGDRSRSGYTAVVAHSAPARRPGGYGA